MGNYIKNFDIFILINLHVIVPSFETMLFPGSLMHATEVKLGIEVYMNPVYMDIPVARDVFYPRFILTGNGKDKNNLPIKLID